MATVLAIPLLNLAAVLFFGPALEQSFEMRKVPLGSLIAFAAVLYVCWGLGFFIFVPLSHALRSIGDPKLAVAWCYGLALYSLVPLVRIRTIRPGVSFLLGGFHLALYMLLVTTLMAFVMRDSIPTSL